MIFSFYSNFSLFLAKSYFIKQTYHYKKEYYSLIQVGMNHFFDGSSSMNKCTLFSDKILIDRRNVGKEVKDRYSAVKKFFDLEVKFNILICNLSKLYD